MKDLPHHIKKLNRNIIRSMHREMAGEMPEIPNWPESESQKRKKMKIRMRDETRAHPSSDLTPAERNKIMKTGRVPIFEKNNAAPKHNPASRKKTPRI